MGMARPGWLCPAGTQAGLIVDVVIDGDGKLVPKPVGAAGCAMG